MTKEFDELYSIKEKTPIGTMSYIPTHPLFQGQKKKHSFIEAILNVGIGVGIALATQLIVFPLFGIKIPMAAHLYIVAIFTVISVARSYLVRRLFNYLHVKEIL